MSSDAMSGREREFRAGPWDAMLSSDREIRMTAPRSALPVKGKYLLGALGIVATLLSLRFVVLGAWPVLIFMLLDMGALAVALHIFGKAAVPEERLRVTDGKVELFRLDGRGRQSRISLPAFWTKLEVSSHSECDCNLWLVFRHERHAVGSCVSAAERRVLIPRISAALASARSRDA